MCAVDPFPASSSIPPTFKINFISRKEEPEDLRSACSQNKLFFLWKSGEFGSKKQLSMAQTWQRGVGMWNRMVGFFLKILTPGEGPSAAVASPPSTQEPPRRPPPQMHWDPQGESPGGQALLRHTRSSLQTLPPGLSHSTPVTSSLEHHSHPWVLI